MELNFKSNEEKTYFEKNPEYADVVAGKLMTYEEALEEIKPGKYRHFKGNEYEVLYIARHSETLEPMVVYRALYGEHGVWVRPAHMWNEKVERDGKTYKRFSPIPATPLPI